LFTGINRDALEHRLWNRRAPVSPAARRLRTLIFISRWHPIAASLLVQKTATGDCSGAENPAVSFGCEPGVGFVAVSVITDLPGSAPVTDGGDSDEAEDGLAVAPNRRTERFGTTSTRNVALRTYP
jgi:hypothetical protein